MRTVLPFQRKKIISEKKGFWFWCTRISTLLSILGVIATVVFAIMTFYNTTEISELKIQTAQMIQQTSLLDSQLRLYSEELKEIKEQHSLDQSSAKTELIQSFNEIYSIWEDYDNFGGIIKENSQKRTLIFNKCISLLQSELQNHYLLTHLDLYKEWKGFLEEIYVMKAFTTPVADSVDLTEERHSKQWLEVKKDLEDFQERHLQFNLYVFKYFANKENLFSLEPH